MGEMADLAVEEIFDDMDMWDRWGMPLEDGYPMFHPMYGFGYKMKFIKPKGPGACPICGSSTEKKTGKHGPFYGCVNFPKCKGSRNLCGK